LAEPLNAAPSAVAPSISAKAPNSSTRVTKVIPGQIKARTPKTIAAIPLSSRSHHRLARACSIGRPRREEDRSGLICIGRSPQI
jgi:hypothetical protein